MSLYLILVCIALITEVIQGASRAERRASTSCTLLPSRNRKNISQTSQLHVGFPSPPFSLPIAHLVPPSLTIPSASDTPAQPVAKKAHVVSRSDTVVYERIARLYSQVYLFATDLEEFRVVVTPGDGWVLNDVLPPSSVGRDGVWDRKNATWFVETRPEGCLKADGVDETSTSLLSKAQCVL